MKLGIQWRHELPPAVLKEIEALIAGLSAWSNEEHTDEGGHADVTAESVTISRDRGTSLNVKKGMTILDGAVAMGGSLTPAALVADADNYSPPGIGDIFVLRVTPSGASRMITGIQDGPRRAPQSGRFLIVFNAGTEDLVLAHNSVSSTDVFRFLNPGAADITLPPSHGALLYYETRSARWIMLANTIGRGGDVVGPASAGDENITVFDGISGKRIKDSGMSLADVFDAVDAAIAAAIALIPTVCYVPVSNGAEPPSIVSNGAGAFALAPYSP